MRDSGQRTALTVRLLGRQAQAVWRRPLVAEGLAVPNTGACAVSFADISGTREPDGEIDGLVTLAGTEPLVVRLAMADPLPRQPRADVVIIRTPPHQPRLAAAALQRAVRERLQATGASVRLRAHASMGHPFALKSPRGEDAPTAMLTEPHPEVLTMLAQAGWRELVAPLTSSQTLRLLENNHASALVIHLGEGLEHRLPVLKLIRRQTDLQSLPVAVVARRWTPQAVDTWLKAGADLVATVGELPRVLTFLKGASSRFRSQRMLSSGLNTGALGDDGAPSPLYGQRMFERIVGEHLATGDPMGFGAVALSLQGGGHLHDLAEAGVYMTMALSPLDIMCRPRNDLYMFAMPYADRYYARKVIRVMQTLVEDLKFGDDANAMTIAVRHASMDTPVTNAHQAMEKLEKLLSMDQQPAASA